MTTVDAEQRRRTIGLVLLVLGTLTGAALLLFSFILPPLVTGRFDIFGAMLLGAVVAFPAGAMYLTVPRLLDRYDPEPAYALFGCLVWGAIASCGYAAMINSGVAVAGEAAWGAMGGEVISTVMSAPLVEEGMKALAIFGVYYFLRREFDGVVDGIIYATFVAIGFATVENVIYYATAAMKGEGVFAFTVLLRGVLAPWGHPLYTSMTGIGFGLARESEKRWVRGLGPVLGYSAAVLLHAAWNGSATFADFLGEESLTFMLVLFPLWLLFVGAFLVMVTVLVRRRGKIIRYYLTDEVAMGTLNPEELELVCSAFGLLRAKLRYGANGVAFVRAAARLALSKWHSARAWKESKYTLSMDFVGPLRKRILDLRPHLRR